MREIIDNAYRTYNEHLQVENKKKYVDFKGWFSASSAGNCYKKLIYQALDYPRDPMKERVIRLLRLGTMLHKDYEDAINFYLKTFKDRSRYTVLLEQRITLPKWNVLGHFDIAIYDHETGILYVYDLKSCGAVKWRLKFGQKPIPPNSFFYEQQIATYTLGIEDLFEKEDGGKEVKGTEMALMWYKKDDSVVKYEEVPLSYLDTATVYWEELNEIYDDIKNHNNGLKNLRQGDPGCPMVGWECKYCAYESDCLGRISN